ncbi:MAG: hypothetical protein PGN16_00040 [Sphingomonas phyllosphaerae]|uniref:hypothetical protein n=1 Tax=Sphingomonas phyllosphaerae TaxID=257003 RepID=UPI002FFBC531
MADLILMHRIEDGHDIELDRNRVVLIEPDADRAGTFITLNMGDTTRSIHVREDFRAVQTELHLSPMERAIRDFEGSPVEVPFA